MACILANYLTEEPDVSVPFLVAVGHDRGVFSLVLTVLSLSVNGRCCYGCVATGPMEKLV